MVPFAQFEVLNAADEVWGVRPATFNIYAISRPVDNIILRDEGRYFTIVGSLIARFLLRRLLFIFLGRLLCGCTVVVIVLIFTVVTFGVILGTSFQSAAPTRTGVFTLSHFLSLVSLPVPVPVPVLLFVFVLLFVSCHDSPRAFFCPLTAGPP